MFTEKHHIEFSAVPPYNFELSVHKPAGWWWSTPNEVFQNGVLWATTRPDSRLFGLKLAAAGTSRKPKICCSVFSDKKMSNQDRDNVTDRVKRSLGGEENINEFYKIALKDKILRETVRDLYEMRAMAWPELFPALILAVTLQMAPMKRSNQMMNLLITNFGETITFNGKTISHWPSPERIAELKSGELRSKAKLGYRAENLVSIAKTLREGFPTTKGLAEMPPEETKKQLMALRGVGE